METTKVWWQSKTILVAILTVTVAIVGIPGIDSAVIEKVVTAIMAAITIITRATAKDKLTLTSTPTTPTE